MYHIIVNPNARSGRGRKYWENIKQILDEHDVEYDLFFSGKRGDSADYARKLYETGSPLSLVILGGDGTINEVLQGLPSLENVTLSTIPIGSSNDLALALGISFNPEEAALHLINKPTILYMDVGKIHSENSKAGKDEPSSSDRRFLVSSGLGYDASICHEALASGIKSVLNSLGWGKLSYLIICLKQLISMKYTDATLTLTDTDETIAVKKLIFMGGMNNRFEGGGFMFAPEASNHDGLIDLCVTSGISKPSIIKLLPTALKGEHIGNEGVSLYRTVGYTVKCSEPVWVHTDGEVEMKADFISVSCEKEAIKIIY